MNLLAFDTSTDTLCIAVQRAEAVWQHRGPGGAQSSAQLLPAIRRLMDEAGLDFKALDAIVFGRGPGSFTGLRTACAIAQGLAFGADVRVLPVDTLLAVAETARAEHGCTEVVAVLDARMNEVYHAPYSYREGVWLAAGDTGVCAPEALHVPAGWSVVGNALAAYGERLAPEALHLAALPTSAALLRLAPALLAGQGSQPAAGALPLYIRDKVAQTTAERAAARLAAAP